MIHFAFAIDSAVTTVDKSLLSDQTLMELFVETLGDAARSAFTDADEAFTDACSWYGVQCDSVGNVQEINWNTMKAGGTLRLEFLPLHTESIEMVYNSMHGGLSPRCLPTGLRNLNLGFNLLGGTVDFTAFPDSLRAIYVQNNNFQGSINLELLPIGLQVLNVSKNSFRGCVNLMHLPRTLEKLGLRGNLFDQVLRPATLSDRIEMLH